VTAPTLNGVMCSTEKERFRHKYIRSGDLPMRHHSTLSHAAGTCSFFTWASEGQDQRNVAIALFVSCLALAELARRERHRGVPLSARGALPRVCMQSVGLELGHVANCHVGGQVVVSAGGGFSCQQKIRWASIVLPRTETGRGQRVRKPFHDIILR